MSNEQVQGNGVHRKASARGKGFWLARWNGQERVFYDGSYGTETSAQQAAIKWVNEQRLGKDKSKFRDKAYDCMNWVLERLQREGVKEEVVDEIRDEMTVRLELYQ